MYTNCYTSAIVFNWISYLLLKDAKQSVLIKKKLHRDEGGSSIPTIRGCSSILRSPVMEGPGPPNDHTWSCRGGSTIWSHLIAALGGGGRVTLPHHTKKYPQCFPKYHRCIPKYHRYIPKYPWQSPKYPHHTSKYPWHTPKYPIIPQSIISLWSSNCKNGHLCHNVHHPVKKNPHQKL